MTEHTLRELRTLEEIERNPSVSQRQLASELGVAVGVANACVRTLVRKGLVKIRGESNRSITYHITKEGRLQKAALAVEWTNNTIDYYVQARRRIGELLGTLASLGVGRAALFAANEAAELVVMLAPAAGITVTDIIGIERARIAETIGTLPVVELEQTQQETDAVIFCTDPTPGELQVVHVRFPEVPLFDLTGREL